MMHKLTKSIRSIPVRAFSNSSNSTTVTPVNLTHLTTEHEKRAALRAAKLREQHLAPVQSPERKYFDDTKIPDTDEANRKRIIYRSKQRGLLEVDLLLGSWASQNVANLSHDELVQYEAILNEETIDIFNYISTKQPVPPHLDTPIMKKLQKYCLSSPLGKASLDGFAKNKQFMPN